MIVYFLCSALFLATMSLLFMLYKPDGILEIDITNPKKDNYCFKIDDLDKLQKKKYIRLKVIVRE